MEKSARPAHSAAAIAQTLAAEIGTAHYDIGDRFPAEEELQARFGVGRHTIREALEKLTEQGMIARRRRSGTFVLAKEPVAPDPAEVHNLLEAGDSSSSTFFQISHIHWIAPSPTLFAEYSGLPQTRWLRVAGMRLMREDKRPLCWSEVFVPQDYAPPREQIIKGDKPIFRMACEASGVSLAYVEEQISPMILPAEAAQAFNSPRDTAALFVRRRYVAHKGATIEISRSVYPGDNFRIHTVIRTP